MSVAAHTTPTIGNYATVLGPVKRSQPLPDNRTSCGLPPASSCRDSLPPSGNSVILVCLHLAAILHVLFTAVGYLHATTFCDAVAT